MKKLIISTFLLFFTLSSCNDEEGFKYEEYSSFSWYTSESWEEAEYATNVDEFITFVDLSNNESIHNWSIPASTKFMKGEFTRGLSDYTPYINSALDTLHTDKLINVLFTEPGIQKITLYNEFTQEVEGATKTEEKWILEKIFTVDVFAKLIPACKVASYDFTDVENPILVDAFTLNETDPLSEDMSSWTTVTIEAGEEIVFTDISTTGRPTGRTWFTEGGKPKQNSQEVANIRYNKPGIYTAFIETKRTGDGLPNYTASKAIPLKINVTASSKPFVFNGTPEYKDGVITFSVTGEIESAINQANNFTVHVTNTAARFDANIDVAAVHINSEDPSLIELILAEQIYNTDAIELSFTSGNIQSIDARSLESFGPEAVAINLGNNVLIDAYAGFETVNGNWKKAFCKEYWVGNNNGSAADPVYARVEDFKFSGNASMRYNSNGITSVNLSGTDFSKPNGLPAGTYDVSYSIYLAPENTMKMFRTLIKTGPTTLATQYWNIETLDRGKWLQVHQTITTEALASGIKFEIRIDAADNTDVTGQQTMYFDDLKWVALQERP